jgi:hypothetical protein
MRVRIAVFSPPTVKKRVRRAVFTDDGRIEPDRAEPGWIMLTA